MLCSDRWRGDLKRTLIREIDSNYFIFYQASRLAKLEHHSNQIITMIRFFHHFDRDTFMKLVFYYVVRREYFGCRSGLPGVMWE